VAINKKALLQDFVCHDAIAEKRLAYINAKHITTTE